MFGLLFSLFVASGPINPETLPFEEVAQIARATHQELAEHDVNIFPSIEVRYRPERTPLGVIGANNGHCRLIINTNKEAWAEWNRFLTNENKAHWRSIIRMSLAHELGHCMPEHRSTWQDIQLSSDTMSGLSPSKTELYEKRTRVLKQELFADTVAILYAKQFLELDERNTAIASMLRARVNFGNQDITHNTANELAQVIESDGFRADEESFGQAAARLLRSISIN